MKKLIRALGLLTAAGAIPACAITLNLRDGTARIDACPGVEFTIVVKQGPHQPTARGTASGGTVRFSSTAFRDIDFSRRVTVDLFASTVPPGSECPIRAGEVYRLADVILPPVPGTSDEYRLDLADFAKVP